MPTSKRHRDQSKSSKSASAFDSNDWWSGEKSSKGSKSKAKSDSRRKKHRIRHEDEQDDGDDDDRSKVSSTKFLPHERLEWGDRRVHGSVYTEQPRRHKDLAYDRLSQSETTSRPVKRKDSPRKARKARRPSRPRRGKSDSSDAASDVQTLASSIQYTYKRKRHKSRSEPRFQPYVTVIEENIEYVRADSSSADVASSYRPRRRTSYYHRSTSAREARKRGQPTRKRSELLERPRTKYYVPSRPVYVYRRDTPDWEAAEVRTSSKSSARIVPGPHGHSRFVRPAPRGHRIKKTYEPRRHASDYITPDSRKYRASFDRSYPTRRKDYVHEDDGSSVKTVPDREYTRRPHRMQRKESSDVSAPTSRKSSLSAARTASLFAAMRRQRAK